MNLDKQIINEKLADILIEGSAAVFAIGDLYIQDTLYTEAVSHHYHSGLNINLEAGFASLGYALEEGGNYSKIYTVNTGHDIDKITGEVEVIFRDLYHADPSAPFEVSDVE